MKYTLTAAAGLIAGAALMMAASPAMAGHVDVGVNIGFPAFVSAPVYVERQPVYVQPQPVYVQPQSVYIQSRPVYVERENEWRGRHWRGREWQEHREHRNEHRGEGQGRHHGHDD